MNLIQKYEHMFRSKPDRQTMIDIANGLRHLEHQRDVVNVHATHAYYVEESVDHDLALDRIELQIAEYEQLYNIIRALVPLGIREFGAWHYAQGLSMPLPMYGQEAGRTRAGEETIGKYAKNPFPSDQHPDFLEPVTTPQEGVIGEQAQGEEAYAAARVSIDEDIIDPAPPSTPEEPANQGQSAQATESISAAELHRRRTQERLSAIREKQRHT